MSQARVRPENLTPTHFRMDGAEAHHVARVLRKKIGDELVLFDGSRRRCRGVVTAVDPSAPSIEGKILAELPVNEDRYRLRLYQGLPKGSKIDFVIEKAVELGADGVVPFLSERGQVKLDADGAAAKALRWNRLAEAAAKQCERADIPPVAAPVELKDLAGALSEGTTLLLIPAAHKSLKTGLRSDEGNILRANSDIINIVVGPESGFSPDEQAMFASWDARPVHMGRRVLRTETAGLVALAILQHELNQR